MERRGRPRRRPPKDRYDSPGLAAAVLAACRKAFPPPPELARRPAEHERAWRRRLKVAGLLDALRAWEREHSFAPGQLRHSFASRVRREHGLEAAQVLLGHQRADVTQVYAERNREKALAVIARIG